MKWTDMRPTKPGWYWFRGEPDLNAIIVWVASDLETVLIPFRPIASVSEMPGQWAGPIMEPEG